MKSLLLTLLVVSTTACYVRYDVPRLPNHDSWITDVNVLGVEVMHDPPAVLPARPRPSSVRPMAQPVPR